jgi:hypothetical protein
MTAQTQKTQPRSMLLLRRAADAAGYAIAAAPEAGRIIRHRAC